MTRFVDPEGREYVTSWDAAVSAARDWAGGGAFHWGLTRVPWLSRP